MVLIVDEVGRCVPAQKLGTVVYACNLRIQEAEGGKHEGHEFKTSLGYIAGSCV